MCTHLDFENGTLSTLAELKEFFWIPETAWQFSPDEYEDNGCLCGINVDEVLQFVDRDYTVADSGDYMITGPLPVIVNADNSITDNDPWNDAIVTEQDGLTGLGMTVKATTSALNLANNILVYCEEEYPEIYTHATVPLMLGDILNIIEDNLGEFLFCCDNDKVVDGLEHYQSLLEEKEDEAEKEDDIDDITVGGLALGITQIESQA